MALKQSFQEWLLLKRNRRLRFRLKRSNKLLKLKVNLSSFFIFIFGIWVLFLSGLFHTYTGSPGVFQAVQLNNLLSQKEEELELNIKKLEKLKVEQKMVQSDSWTQHYEIRKTLGYVYPSELLFDFSYEN